MSSSRRRRPSGHYFGTHQIGRDLLARTLCGTRISLTSAMVATLVSVITRVTYGAFSGCLGGRVDQAMMRFVDIMYVLPYILFVIPLTVIFGRNLYLLFAAIGAREWLTMARIVRGQTLSLKEREFIEAARTTGLGTPAIIFKHIAPNLSGNVVTCAALTIPEIVATESFLSYLGSCAMHSTQRTKKKLSADRILTVKNLNVGFDTDDGIVHAVRGVNCHLDAGECLGIVGKSGSCKSQTFLAVGLLSGNGTATGEIDFQGRNILETRKRELNSVRGARISMIFQDPLTSLTPQMRVVDQMREVLGAHRNMHGPEAIKLCLDWLERVQIPEAARRLRQ